MDSMKILGISDRSYPYTVEVDHYVPMILMMEASL